MTTREPWDVQWLADADMPAPMPPGPRWRRLLAAFRHECRRAVTARSLSLYVVARVLAEAAWPDAGARKWIVVIALVLALGTLLDHRPEDD